MVRYKWVMGVLYCLFLSAGIRAQRSETVEMDKVKMTVTLDWQGAPHYAVWYKEKPVLLSSGLGFVLDKDSIFYKGFSWVGAERKTVDEVWQPVWGVLRDIRNHYEQL